MIDRGLKQENVFSFQDHRIKSKVLKIKETLARGEDPMELALELVDIIESSKPLEPLRVITLQELIDMKIPV